MSRPASYNAAAGDSSWRHPDPRIGGEKGPAFSPPPSASRTYDRDGYPVPPSAPSGNGAYDPSYFPPPPRREYEDGRYKAGDSHVDPNTRQRGAERAVGEEGAITPYDEERAWAQYNDAYGPPGQEYDRRSPPYEEPIDSRRYDDGERIRYRDREDRRRYSRRRSWDEYSYPPRSAMSEEAHRSPPPPARAHKRKGSERIKDFLKKGDGDRGFGATLLGGAAGAYLGDRADRGALGAIGGALIGAIAANAGERQLGKRQERKQGEIVSPRRRATRSGDNGDRYYRAQSVGDRDESHVDEFRPRRASRGPPRSLSRGPSRRRDGYSDTYYSD